MGKPNEPYNHKTDDEIAQLLYEAEVYGHARTSRKHSIASSTLHSWRKRLETDAGVKGRFDELMAVGTAEWSEKVNRPIVAAIAFINEAMESLDPKDPVAANAAANALKVLAEAKFASEVFNVFARKQSAINGAAGREDAADRLIDGRSATTG